MTLPGLVSSNDRTNLTHSTAAREATHEEATPGHLGKKYPGPPMPGPPTPGPPMPLSSHESPATFDVVSLPAAHQPSIMPEPDYYQTLPRRPSSSRVCPGEFRHVLAPSITTIPEIPPELAGHPTTEFRAGMVEKVFHIHTSLLTQWSPVFAAISKDAKEAASEGMVRMQSGRSEAKTVAGPFYFPDLDEYSFALFVKWMYAGDLNGPHDFHSMHHYMCLYVLAHRFDIEALRNTVMDLVRSYYHRENMTAPAFRLEHIYRATSGPCLMRQFLIATAAYRSLSISEKFGGLSDSMKGILSHDGDIAPDFANEVISLARHEREDARKGDPCQWHEHLQTARCPKWGGFEPFETA